MSISLAADEIIKDQNQNKFWKIYQILIDIEQMIYGSTGKLIRNTPTKNLEIKL